MTSLQLPNCKKKSAAHKNGFEVLVSDKGRKPLMFVPFCGHVISGVLLLLNVYYEAWDPRLLWLGETYILFGGYTLLSIAM